MLKALNQKVFHFRLWVWLVVGLGLAGGLLYVALTQPQQGTWRFAACRAFLEQEQRFPQTIRVIVAGEGQTSATLGYSSVNANGAEQVRMFECDYNIDGNGHPSLTRITVDRVPLAEDVIARYNNELPVILTQKLDTALPPNAPRDLKDFR